MERVLSLLPEEAASHVLAYFQSRSSTVRTCTVETIHVHIPLKLWVCENVYIVLCARAKIILTDINIYLAVGKR